MNIEKEVSVLVIDFMILVKGAVLMSTEVEVKFLTGSFKV